MRGEGRGRETPEEKNEGDGGGEVQGERVDSRELSASPERTAAPSTTYRHTKIKVRASQSPPSLLSLLDRMSLRTPNMYIMRDIRRTTVTRSLHARLENGARGEVGGGAETANVAGFLLAFGYCHGVLVGEGEGRCRERCRRAGERRGEGEL